MHKLQTVYVTLRGCASGPIYSFFGGLGGCRGENDANRGKHRTEVTEVTEGDWGWSVDSVASVRETRVEIGGDAFPPSRGPRPEADGVHGPAFSH
jgi:hypothetical protein